MGGAVAETIRKENGEIIKMARKTGAYNWMFFSKEFNTDQIDLAIEKHVKIFNEMKEDYESGEPYTHRMSPVYGWCVHTAPVDYGLVVIDFQNKKIHSMQGYDNPGYISLVSLNNSLSYIQPEESYEFLVTNNLLKILDKNHNVLGDIESVFGKISSKKLLNKFEKIMHSKNNPNEEIPVNLYTNFIPTTLVNFKFIHYDESPQGHIEYIKNLVNDGFIFTTEEIDMWKERINDYDNEYFFDDASLSEEEWEAKAEKEKEKLINEIDSLLKKNNTSLKIK